jgi:SAM-dependent methyltransferase
MRHVPPLSRRELLGGSLLFAGAAAIAVPADAEPQERTPLPATAKMRQEAEALRPLVQTTIARRFLDAVADLKEPAPRKLFADPATRALYSEASAAKLDADARAKLRPVNLTEQLYYFTLYGTPLAYVRPLEILGQNGVAAAEGKRLLDFGYGTIGHLKTLARCGAEVVGVDVDPFLRELYSSPEDTGIVPRAKEERVGRVTLIDGRWPADPATTKAVGGGYDLIVSKNTLKRGYIHPERPVDKKYLVDLGVSDEAFVKALYDALKPGGRVLLYNLAGALSKPDEPYNPSTDGRSPFPKSLWEAAGFRVTAFDAEDHSAARAMGRALGWDKGPRPMDLENGLFAHYTLAVR